MTKKPNRVIENIQKRLTSVEVTLKGQPTKKDIAKTAAVLEKHTKDVASELASLTKKGLDDLAITTNLKIETLATKEDIEGWKQLETSVEKGARVVNATGRWTLTALATLGVISVGWGVIAGGFKVLALWVLHKLLNQ